MHSLIRALAMAVAIASFPLCALLSRMMARPAAGAYDDLLGGKPLPALTSFVIVGQANSPGLIYACIAISILIAAFGAWLFRLSEANLWKATGQVLTTAVAGSLSFALFVATMVAAFLPLVAFISPLK